ncbi:hypothetical protein GCM10028807_26400 [Spirosoma daeguense]
MPPPKKRINIELHLSLSATFLSLAALIVSVFQTKISREEQHASVWPYLQTIGSNFDQEFHFGLENKGVGPAIIKKYVLSYKGKEYPNIQALFFENIGRRTLGGKGFGGMVSGDVFKSGENLELLFVSKNDSIVQKVGQMIADTSFRVRIHYADVYGNCWLLDHNKVTEVSECPEP